MIYLPAMGIAFALLALFSWGVGDFLIQRSARKFGDWLALFYITAFATVGLFPFVYRDIPDLFSDSRGFILLSLATIVLLFASILDFEALRVGKISVVEAVYAFEVPITVALSYSIIGERLNSLEMILIGILVIGTILVAIKSFDVVKAITVERGVWLAVFATIGMGFVNFLFGVGARATSPLMINWFTSVWLCFISYSYLASQRRLHEIRELFRENRALVTAVGIADNLAWVSFSVSTLYIPIAIATAISESYIALAAGLGIFLNREKLQPHQMFGFLLCLSAVIALSLITSA